MSEDPIGFKSGSTNHYGYVSNNPLIFLDPFGLYICDATGGQIPIEVLESDIYKKLKNDPTVLVTISLSNNFPEAGLTKDRGSKQEITINPNKNINRKDLIDTYMHELNHAYLNLAFRGKTSEEFDTDLMLRLINQNINMSKP